MLLILLVPFFYFGVCSGMSSALPDVAHPAFNPPAQVAPAIQDPKSVNQIPVPAQELQAKPAGQTPV